MTRRGSGFLDAAEQILRERGEPMRGEEIIRIGLERGLFTTITKDEEGANRSLISTLRSDINRGRNRRGFVHHGNNLFGLAEWGNLAAGNSAPKTRERRARSPAPVNVAVPAGISLDMLERIRQLLPADEFRRYWGEAYDQLLAAERAKTITPVNSQHLLDRIQPLVQRIQDFLQGHGSESPKSEVVCDWIFVCYTLELYREGAALWRYVNQDEVSAWQYERTAKISAACRARISS